MKVYNSITMDMNTWEVISEDSYEYDGKVALCGGSGGNQKVENVSKPWEPAAPLMKGALSEIQNWFQTPQSPFPISQVASFTPEQMMAQNLGSMRGMFGSPVTNAGGRDLTSTLQGYYLNPETNPWLQQTFMKGATDIMDVFKNQGLPYLTSGTEMAGRSGSDTEALLKNELAKTTMNQLNNLATNIYGGAYQDERSKMLQAAALAPTYAGGEWTDIQNLMGMGAQKQGMAQSLLGELAGQWDWRQNYDYNKIQQALNLLLPIAHSGTSSTQTSNAGGSSFLSNLIPSASAGLGTYALMNAIPGAQPYTIPATALAFLSGMF